MPIFDSNTLDKMQDTYIIYTESTHIIYFISQFWLIFQHKKSPILGIEC